MSDYRIRVATAADASIIAAHRVAMFRDMGELDDDGETLEELARQRLADELESGHYLGWLAETNGKVIAGAGVLLHEYHPTPKNLRGRPTAYMLNVYTDPDYRNRGIASDLVRTVCHWCAKHDIPRVSLHASEFGRRVYERLGFVTSNEMRADILSGSEI